MADARGVQVFWELSRMAAGEGSMCGPHAPRCWQFFLKRGGRCYVTHDEGGRRWVVSGYEPTYDEELDRTDWVQRVLECPDLPHLGAEEQASIVRKAMDMAVGRN